MVIVAFVLMGKRANRQRLIANGVPGQARVLGARQTSLYVNGSPQVELELEITTANRAPYTVILKEVVPMIMTGRLTNGQPLPVMVDPLRPDSVVIVWENALG
jgi:hypothetical protein